MPHRRPKTSPMKNPAVTSHLPFADIRAALCQSGVFALDRGQRASPTLLYNCASSFKGEAGNVSLPCSQLRSLTYCEGTSPLKRTLVCLDVNTRKPGLMLSQTPVTFQRSRFANDTRLCAVRRGKAEATLRRAH